MSLALLRPRLRERRAREHAHHALAVALEPQQAVPLTRPQELDDAGEPELALVERLVRVAEVLPDLADVHRPAWRLLRLLEQSSRELDGLGGFDR